MSEYLEGGVEKWSISDLSPDKITNIEADCYWCLSKLLDGMQDHYTFAQPGIQRLVFKLKELVRRIDGNSLLISLTAYRIGYGKPFINQSCVFLNLARTCVKTHGGAGSGISSIRFSVVQLSSDTRGMPRHLYIYFCIFFQSHLYNAMSMVLFCSIRFLSTLLPGYGILILRKGIHCQISLSTYLPVFF